MQPMDSEHAAYVFLLRDGAAALIGAAGVVCREATRTGEARPFTRAWRSIFVHENFKRCRFGFSGSWNTHRSALDFLGRPQ